MIDATSIEAVCDILERSAKAWDGIADETSDDGCRGRMRARADESRGNIDRIRALLAPPTAPARNGEGVAVRVERTAGGPSLYIGETLVRYWVGTAFDGDAEALADSIRAALLAAPAAPAPTDREQYAQGWRDAKAGRHFREAAPAPAAQACNCRAGDCDGSCAPYIGQQPAPAAQADDARLDAAFNAATAAATQLERQQSAIPAEHNIPQGWLLVPAQPTEEMLKAPDSGRLIPASVGETVKRWDRRRKDWAAMIAAVPAAPDTEPAKSTPPECTCPSGNGSLRHPCPVHAVEPTIGNGEIIALEWAVMHLERIATTDEQRQKLTRLRALAKCAKWSATPADAASEADKSMGRTVTMLLAWIEEAVEYVGCTTWSPSLESDGRKILATLQREQQQGADRG